MTEHAVNQLALIRVAQEQTLTTLVDGHRALNTQHRQMYHCGHDIHSKNVAVDMLIAAVVTKYSWYDYSQHRLLQPCVACLPP